MIQGSCLCGEVRYVAEKASGPMVHCHCRICRKAHGSAFSTVLPVRAAGFRWDSGETLLAHFESSVGKQRWFCTQCGSQLISTRTAVPDSVLLRAGCIDSGYTDGAVAHIWVESAPPWNTLSDQLPQFKRGYSGPFPGAEREHTTRQADEADVQ